MNKKIISTIIAVGLLIGAGTQAIATPLSDSQKQNIEDNRAKYDEVKNKITEYENILNKLTDEIDLIAIQVEKNKQEIKDTESKIDATEKQIEKVKGEIKEKEDILGDRMRAVYKNGGQGNYLGVILSSTSFSDLLSKVEAVTKVMSIDKKIIDELNAKKKELDDKVALLEEKNDELNKLNEENRVKLDELNKKKSEQQVVIDQLKEEQKKIVVDLTEAERPLIQYFVEIVNNSDSSIDELNNAINGLRSARTQVKSSVIDEEIVQAIEKAKDAIEQKKAAQVANQSTVSRGGALPAVSGNASSIIAYAYQFVGKPYVYGATGPNSFDCSGFTSYVMNKYGVGLGRTTYDQVTQGTPVSYSDLQPGDLVFTRGVGHVGIYVGNGNMIHASRPGVGVIVGPIYDFSSARRVIK
jgi:peptidoglycan hydrolase CwlO-like protein